MALKVDLIDKPFI